jgi:LacI family transcriptional regulator, gluconate utilization system Gnt-I transcriptional repressor
MARAPSHSAEHHAASAPQAVTLKDVARLAGVSPITASRALTRPDLLTAETRERVLRAVEQIGYVPNALAGGLTSRRTRLVAVTVPTMAHSLFSEMAECLIDSLAAAGYETMLGISRYDARREEAWLAAILSRRPDGVALTGTEHTPRARRLLDAAGIPVVELWDYSASPLNCAVGFIQEEAGRAALKHLLQAGYRSPAILRADDARAARRAEGFRAAAEDMGVPAVAEVVFSASQPQAGRGRTALRQLLADAPAADAVFCSSDALAQGVIAEAHAHAILIPAELGVIGFGDQALAADIVPSLSTVRIDGAEIGNRAASLLLDRISNRANATPAAVNVGFAVLGRESTARRTVGQPPAAAGAPAPSLNQSIAAWRAASWRR